MTRATKYIMGWIVWNLWDSLLVGHPAQKVEMRRQRMIAPRPGDLVVEITTLYMLLLRDPELQNDQWDGQFLVYLRSENLTHQFDPDAVQEPDSPPPQVWHETVHICQQPDGSEFTWHNAEMVAVPISSNMGDR